MLFPQPIQSHYSDINMHLPSSPPGDNILLDKQHECQQRIQQVPLTTAELLLLIKAKIFLSLDITASFNIVNLHPTTTLLEILARLEIFEDTGWLEKYRKCAFSIILRKKLLLSSSNAQRKSYNISRPKFFSLTFFLNLLLFIPEFSKSQKCHIVRVHVSIKIHSWEINENLF